MGKRSSLFFDSPRKVSAGANVTNYQFFWLNSASFDNSERLNTGLVRYSDQEKVTNYQFFP
jgi:hypothetical protein